LKFQQFLNDFRTSFALSFLQSSMSIISERCSGLWNRLIAAGVTNRQLLISHFFESLIIVSLQYCELVVYVVYEMKTVTWDSTVLVLFLIFLNGICGTATGILTSLLYKSVTFTMYAGQAFLILSLFCCGKTVDSSVTSGLMEFSFFRHSLADSSASDIPSSHWLRPAIWISNNLTEKHHFQSNHDIQPANNSWFCCKFSLDSWIF
jgi:hypothetical protein